MTSITWAGPKCVQEAAAILGPQNRIQGRCHSITSSPYMGGMCVSVVVLIYLILYIIYLRLQFKYIQKALLSLMLWI